MPSFEEGQESMSQKDREVSSLFTVISGRIIGRHPDLGYAYHSSLARPLSVMTNVLQTRHGLNKTEVFERILVASELSARIQEHVAPNIPEDPNLIYN